MDERIARVLNGRATDIERRGVQHWRRLSPENERTYQEACDVWRATRTLGGSDRTTAATHGAPETGRPPTPRTVAAEAERRRVGAIEPTRPPTRAARIGWIASAAILIALALVTTRGADAPGADRALVPIESASSPDQVVTMSLSDGSVVRLARASTLEFPPAAERREVVLSGRAFFAVATADVPFVVHTDAGEVSVRGTRFEVDASGSPVRVVVVEGAVSLGGPKGEALVGPGQVAYLERGGPPRVLDRTDVWALLDWGPGPLLYQATPLREVAPELERAFGRPVRVREALASTRITAWFADESPEEVVAAICLIAGARCEVGNDTIVIGR